MQQNESRLRRTSGAALVALFRQSGFSIVGQKGSHIKRQREIEGGDRQTLTVPNHAELDTGTCRAILRQASRYIPETELRSHFYTD